jgi:lipoate-protein ligase A
VSHARLIIDPPAQGTWNMAVDEALLESAGNGATTLRLYEWNEPTLSLGYFQAAADRAGHEASSACPLVRRASGGGAIVHHREMTYCLAVPIAERFGQAADALFATVHLALIEALAGLGIRAQLHAASPARSASRPPPPSFLCFQRRTPGDVLVGSAKIAGSAQRRQRGGLVQHGSILLAQSACAPELPGIAEVTGVRLSAQVLAPSFCERLAVRWGVDWNPAPLSAVENERASACERDRFASPTWTYRR